MNDGPSVSRSYDHIGKGERKDGKGEGRKGKKKEGREKEGKRIYECKNKLEKK